ncbi:Cyclopentanol dehydrogenase [Paraburkholderia aspalathi]|jgi:NAD(P)-dependent dehydrogenase (short-subunit alcohol dehydrogenase family)|uniref:Cyclopentanol dehydrogenase n=1 Tax=Paraburkholderia aspalathi TaxID=1324617 RepID=A0A1I7E291_9BURK|nr:MULTISPECIES: glucose 1-dehydrogenase [Paraburkholderia]MBK3818701.1 glucose 1-dehydrogenase [Paraburkholderia aspalathi]MBK3830615.1 glucose 1-dehydrogenase [Paraburkholderia aspalathi]MBK3839023.1 glucose 1-dehydrogenase [Paraburkholderia aspalathi]MBK3860255.1 glucose 1-dehydrogenase [Paraburkholderia aspalathi]MCX4137058.1 glucose 1-dehydrogenase [Paraburkholderia aspalathi]
MTTSLYDNIHSTKHAGKVALVTGGSTGIGLATAKRLAREGATVFITGRRQAELDAAVSEIGHGARAIRGDISSAEDLKKVVDTVSAEHQRIDILFANAGGGEFSPLGQITEAQFDKYFDINVKGTLQTVQSALPFMRAGSAIVITGSITSIQGVPAFGVYAATKAALRSFARTWASDLKGRDIRVNVVAPGVVVTPAYKTELKLSDEQIEAYCKEVAETTPLGRVGSTDEIAKAVSFLASDDASYITGIELFVDGGRVQV